MTSLELFVEWPRDFCKIEPSNAADLVFRKDKLLTSKIIFFYNCADKNAILELLRYQQSTLFKFLEFFFINFLKSNFV